MDESEHILRFYGRRKAKALRITKQNAYDDILPQFTIAPPEANTDPLSFFNGQYKKLWLEIGFGGGEHLVYQALQNPDIAMIGCEPFLNGIAALCASIKEYDIKNILIWPDDARLLLSQLKPQSIDRCFLLNSDPWPKTRHFKRRFIQTETLDELHRILKPGAPFRMSTDHASLAVWQLDKTYHHGGFEWTAKTVRDWMDRPVDLPETRYQKKGAKHGRPTVFLDFLRKS